MLERRGKGRLEATAMSQRSHGTVSSQIRAVANKARGLSAGNESEGEGATIRSTSSGRDRPQVRKEKPQKTGSQKSGRTPGT